MLPPCKSFRVTSSIPCCWCWCQFECEKVDDATSGVPPTTVAPLSAATECRAALRTATAPTQKSAANASSSSVCAAANALSSSADMGADEDGVMVAADEAATRCRHAAINAGCCDTRARSSDSTSARS